MESQADSVSLSSRGKASFFLQASEKGRAFYNALAVLFSKASFALGLTGTLLSAVLGGGFLIEFAVDDPCLPHRLFRFAVIFSVGVFSGSLALFLLKKDKKLFLFKSAFFLLITGATLYGANSVVSFLLPRWPVIGLHGIKPASFWRQTNGTQPVGFNSWGQRDKERARQTLPGIYRVAFVGDSFLEESIVPLSVRVEENLRPSPVEILNLGVSNSAPDEYFYRIKNITLPLKPKHCFLFFYTGNDFISECTLKSFWGLASVYPRDSLLSLMGLSHLNHILTNHKRPFLTGWGKSSLLYEMEKSRQKTISAANDENLKQFLLSFVDEKYQPALLERLNQPHLQEFFAVLRNPDDGLFRSYYLQAALRFAAGEIEKYPPISETHSFGWIKKAAELCRKEGVAFTLVVVPEAFQVDSRMQKQYSHVADMRALFRAKTEAAERLVEHAEEEGIDCINLFPILDNQPGTYLNLDGHWSSRGIELVSEAMTKEMRRRMKKPV